MQRTLACPFFRKAFGWCVPIGGLVNISQTYGPDPVIRYNGYPAADLIGQADPAVLSSSQAIPQRLPRLLQEFPMR